MDEGLVLKTSSTWKRIKSSILLLSSNENVVCKWKQVGL